MSKETPDKELWAYYFKQTKNNIEGINDSLFNHIQNLEKENVIVYLMHNIKLFKLTVNSKRSH
jgi:hypothetical protein